MTFLVERVESRAEMLRDDAVDATGEVGRDVERHNESSLFAVDHFPTFTM